MSYRRMLPFILLNIIVSASVVLVILWWWDGRTEESPAPAVALVENPDAPLMRQDVPAVEEPPAELSEITIIATPDEAGPEIHVVAAGETLGQISSRYDVSMDDIMNANGMSNANFLFVGQELIIPQPGMAEEVAEEAVPEVQDEAEAENEDAALAPIPTEPPGDGAAVIEIAEVVGPGQLPLEAVQIVNNGSREANLAEWKLADQFGNYYEFRAITLFGDGAGIMIHTAEGQDSATDLYWGEEEPLWSSGDMVILYDAGGQVIAEFQIP